MNNIGIIFDLDGTLWDTSVPTLKAANDVAKENNLKSISLDTIIRGMGESKDFNAKSYYPEVSLEKALELLDKATDINFNYLKNKEAIIYDNVETTLQTLSKKYNLYIVSNCFDDEYINTFKNYLNVEFKDYIAAGSMNISKGEAIKLIISKNNMDKAIYVGDTLLDQKSSKDANIPFIYCKYGFGKIDDYEYSINSISELDNTIKEIIK